MHLCGFIVLILGLAFLFPRLPLPSRASPASTPFSEMVCPAIAFQIERTSAAEIVFSGARCLSVALGYVGKNVFPSIWDVVREKFGSLSLVSSGNVGIGTTSPAGILDVEGGSAASGNGTNLTLAAQNGQASGNTNGGNIILLPGAKNGSGTVGGVGIGTTDPLGLQLYIKSSKDVGVGYDRGGTAYNSSFNFYTAGTSKWMLGLISATASEDFHIWNQTGTHRSNFMIQSSTGNVGIGTTNPDSAKPAASIPTATKATRQASGRRSKRNQNPAPDNGTSAAASVFGYLFGTSLPKQGRLPPPFEGLLRLVVTKTLPSSERNRNQWIRQN